MLYKRETRKLAITGQAKTYLVTLPKWMVEGLGWRKGQKLEVKVQGKKIIILDWEKKRGKPSKRQIR